jgi:hypothetical protein
MKFSAPDFPARRLPSTSLRLAALVSGLTTASPLFAHPGHGLGPLGHDTQHALWNFAGMVLIGAALLIARYLEKNRK